MASDLDNDNVDATMMALLMVFLFWTMCAAVCSFTVLFLIRKMKLKNGHVRLIWTMSCFQLLYDVTLFFAAINVGSYGVFIAANICQEIGGISSSLTSNFMAFIAYYVVKYTKSIDVYRYYPYILAVILTPSLVNSLLYFMSCFPPYHYLRWIAQFYVYYIIRLVSIAINFIVSLATILQIRSMSSSAIDMPATPHEKAIRTLATRLMYYPIVQAISRSAVSWYEAVYGFTFSPESGDSQSKFIGQCFFALLTPIASFGYLMIFLLMQPNAYECLMCTLFCRPYVAPMQITAANLKQSNSKIRSSGGGGGVRNSFSRQLRNVVGGSSVMSPSHCENVDYSYSHNSMVSDSEYNNNNSIQHVINTILANNNDIAAVEGGVGGERSDSDDSIRDKFDEELWLLVSGGPDYDENGEAPSMASPSVSRWNTTSSLNERLLTPIPNAEKGQT